MRVGEQAGFRFHPQPTIPFAGSAYESRMEVSLADSTSRFQMSEIFTCGRMPGERRLPTGITTAW